jgi:hypothetical protein
LGRPVFHGEEADAQHAKAPEGGDLLVTTVPEVREQIGFSDYNLLGELLTQLDAKRPRNDLRARYYDMKNLFRDLGISIPPGLRNLEVAMGWPAKAVDLLARRIRMDGFVLPGGDVGAWGIPEIWRDNRMESEAPQAHVSALIHTPAFIATSLGDVASGEPEVLLTVQDASSATGIWDVARRGLKAYVAILAADDMGPTRLIMLTPTDAHGLTRLDSTGSRWDVRSVRHGLRRVPVEPLVYKPRIGRPFGSSRISRAVMSITDSAMRTVVRSEVGAEFYSSPQRYLLGADEDTFVGPDGTTKGTWDLVMGRILAVPLGVDDSGESTDIPKVGQFPQVTMQPHTDHLRMWATLFQDETGVSMSSLVAQANPASAEAIYADKEDLVLEAEGCADAFTPTYVRSMVTGIQMRDNLAAPPAELRGLGVRWRDPSTPSRAAATDAVMKQVAAGVLPPDSVVALEQLGYDDTTIQRVMGERRRSAGSAALRAIAERRAVTDGDASAG